MSHSPRAAYGSQYDAPRIIYVGEPSLLQLVQPSVSALALLAVEATDIITRSELCSIAKVSKSVNLVASILVLRNLDLDDSQ